MSMIEDILRLVDSAVEAAQQVSADIAEIRRIVSEHPEIDSSATRQVIEDVHEVLGDVVSDR